MCLRRQGPSSAICSLKSLMDMSLVDCMCLLRVKVCVVDLVFSDVCEASFVCVCVCVCVCTPARQCICSHSIFGVCV